MNNDTSYCYLNCFRNRMRQDMVHHGIWGCLYTGLLVCQKSYPICIRNKLVLIRSHEPCQGTWYLIGKMINLNCMPLEKKCKIPASVQRVLLE